MITRFNFIADDWKRVKNHCRTTVNKDFSDVDATDEFKRKLLLSEHSPIRLLQFDWTWNGIPYWLSTEWSRHKFEKFISSQRNDRQKNYDRNAARQDVPVRFDGYANMQSIIDAWRKRLCGQATKEARTLAEDFKAELHKTHPYESDVCVPQCVYRCGCSEFRSCGLWKQYLSWVSAHCRNTGEMVEVLTDIEKRYALYNAWFYFLRAKND